MKKIFCSIVSAIIPLSSLMAWPGHCPPPPPPHHYYHHYCGGSSGVRLAADIVGLVGVSLGTARILTAPPVQPVVVQQPVVVPQTPVVVQQPVQQPVVVQQSASSQTKPVPKRVTIKPDGTRIEEY